MLTLLRLFNHFFQENGPYLAGWDSQTEKTFLLANRHTWNANHNVLYIDNPVGTGFSFTDQVLSFFVFYVFSVIFILLTQVGHKLCLFPL